jgi:hypothetical protein
VVTTPVAPDDERSPQRRSARRSSDGAISSAGDSDDEKAFLKQEEPNHTAEQGSRATSSITHSQQHKMVETTQSHGRLFVISSLSSSDEHDSQIISDISFSELLLLELELQRREMQFNEQQRQTQEASGGVGTRILDNLRAAARAVNSFPMIIPGRQSTMVEGNRSILGGTCCDRNGIVAHLRSSQLISSRPPHPATHNSSFGMTTSHSQQRHIHPNVFGDTREYNTDGARLMLQHYFAATLLAANLNSSAN